MTVIICFSLFSMLYGSEIYNNNNNNTTKDTEEHHTKVSRNPSGKKVDRQMFGKSQDQISCKSGYCHHLV